MMVVLSKSPVGSVLALVVTLVSVSAHYIFLNAQFLAIVNIIVYAGAVMVLFLFVVMLMNLRRHPGRYHLLLTRLTGFLLGLVFLVALWMVGGRHVQGFHVDAATLHTGNSGLVGTIGQLLFSKYAFPFELTGVLFLSAILAGILLARKPASPKEKNRGPGPANPTDE